MRRLPIYFLIDVSESMVGDPIEQVQQGMRNIIQELRMDPYALETVFVSVIAFAGKAKVLIPLTELYKFYPPTFPIGGGTSLGAGLDCLMNDINTSVQKTTTETKGDWKPIIFLFTDGTPTDNPTSAIQEWNKKYRRHCNLVAVSIGKNVNPRILGQLTDNILRLNETDAQTFKEFFKWVTASIKTSSMSVSEYADEDIKLSKVDGINLEKVNPQTEEYIDENFAVFLGKCQTTKSLYLIKFAKRSKPLNIEGLENFNSSDFKLVGAYPINEMEYNELSVANTPGPNINTIELIGQPTCPCCGNQLGFVVCECGRIFCAGENPVNQCPWCGMQGELGSISGGMDIQRTRG